MSSAPSDRHAEVISRLRSSGSRWVVTDYYLEPGPLATNPTYGKATLARPNGSDSRTIYLGEPATMNWGDAGHIVFTEEQSGARHVVDVPGGRYDYREDDPLNHAAVVVYTVGSGLVVVAVGCLLGWLFFYRRHGASTSARAGAVPR